MSCCRDVTLTQTPTLTLTLILTRTYLCLPRNLDHNIDLIPSLTLTPALFPAVTHFSGIRLIREEPKHMVNVKVRLIVYQFGLGLQFLDGSVLIAVLIAVAVAAPAPVSISLSLSPALTLYAIHIPMSYIL